LGWRSMVVYPDEVNLVTEGLGSRVPLARVGMIGNATSSVRSTPLTHFDHLMSLFSSLDGTL
jgi:hypothetical protein